MRMRTTIVTVLPIRCQLYLVIMSDVTYRAAWHCLQRDPVASWHVEDDPMCGPSLRPCLQEGRGGYQALIQSALKEYSVFQ
jgi:hypothetical protein